jgi:tetratricopeptide (TPR) repeat protein
VHDAVVHLNKAAAISPRDKRPYQYLGILYLRNRIVSEAEKNFLKVLTIDPFNVDARFGLVVLYQEQQKLDEALRLAKEMELLAPEYPQLHLIIANVFFLRAEYDSAISHAQIQVLSESKEPAGHYMLGVLYRFKGLTSEAEWEFDQVKYLTGKEPMESHPVMPQSLYDSLGKMKTIGGKK